MSKTMEDHLAGLSDMERRRLELRTQAELLEAQWSTFNNGLLRFQIDGNGGNGVKVFWKLGANEMWDLHNRIDVKALYLLAEQALAAAHFLDKVTSLESERHVRELNGFDG